MGHHVISGSTIFCCCAAICLNGAILLFCGASIVTFAVFAYNLHQFGTLWHFACCVCSYGAAKVWFEKLTGVAI